MIWDVLNEHGAKLGSAETGSPREAVEKLLSPELLACSAWRTIRGVRNYWFHLIPNPENPFTKQSRHPNSPAFNPWIKVRVLPAADQSGELFHG